jgi:biopolymer transport protein ExbB/TolQ
MYTDRPGRATLAAMNDDEETPDPAKKLIIAGLVVGGTMVTVGPMVGMFGTFNGLFHAFGAVGETHASEKATVLAEGIDDAMAASNTGMGFAAVGGVIASICAILLWRRTKTRRKNLAS